MQPTGVQGAQEGGSTPVTYWRKFDSRRRYFPHWQEQHLESGLNVAHKTEILTSIAQLQPYRTTDHRRLT